MPCCPSAEMRLCVDDVSSADFGLIRVSNRILTTAATLLPIDLRSLDAIHLATAEQLGDDLGVIVTYDTRMARAAELLDYRVEAPH